VVTDFVELVPPVLQLYVRAPEAVRSIEVVVQVSVPEVGDTATDGVVVLLLMVAEAVAVQPFAAVPVTV
jgi:hypothetical protein